MPAPIHEVAISWGSKSGDEYRAALEERNRSKVGRMARLRGQVETAEALPELLPLPSPLQEKIAKTVEATGRREKRGKACLGIRGARAKFLLVCV
jgi:hypothetical protein